MLLFDQKKAMNDFYNKHKAFLYWYLEKHSNISERLYHLVLRYFVERLKEDIGKLIVLNEYEQRKWIMRLVDDFAAEDEQ